MSLLINRYAYHNLERTLVAGKRLYVSPDGKSLPSVTTILDSTKDKTHLKEWRARVGEEQANLITKEASGIGARMHKYLEKYVTTGVWPEAGSNPYAKQAYDMAHIVKNNAVDHMDEIWGSEISLYYPEIYAGTTDIICSYNGAPAICDFKQANKMKLREWIQDYFLQLAAYAEAHNKVYNTNIQHGYIFMCSRDMQFKQFEIDSVSYRKYADSWWRRVEHYYNKQN